MSSSPSASPAPHRPRARLILQSVVVMLAVTACCMFAGLIAGKYPRFIDATATRAHRLSPGTLETLSRLTGPTELVVTINSAAIDPRAAERTHDVLDAFDRASDNLTVTTIDVASASGVEQLDAVWRRMGDRYAPEIVAQRAAIESAAASAGELAARLERIGGTLAELERTVADADPNAEAVRRFLGNSSGFCRLGAKDINDGVAGARDALKTTIGRSPVPAFDTAAGAIRKPLPTISGQLAEVSKTIDNASAAKDTEVSPALRDRLKPLGPELLNVRDRLARVEQAIEELPRLRLVNVARALERSTTALVIGPPSKGADGRDLAAVDIDALFPPRTAADNAGTTHLDLRARTEELIGSALASLVNPAPPILVLMHGEDKRFAPEFTLFSQVFQRLHLRGIDIVEWPVWLDKQLPSLAKINPRGDRPVVFATIYTIPDKPQDAARYIALTHAIEQLAGAGKPLLLSVNPSTMPAIGQPDVMFEFLSGKDAEGAGGRGEAASGSRSIPAWRSSTGSARPPTRWSPPRRCSRRPTRRTRRSPARSTACACGSPGRCRSGPSPTPRPPSPRCSRSRTTARPGPSRSGSSSGRCHCRSARSSGRRTSLARTRSATTPRARGSSPRRSSARSPRRPSRSGWSWSAPTAGSSTRSPRPPPSSTTDAFLRIRATPNSSRRASTGSRDRSPRSR